MNAATELRVGIVGCGGIANGKHMPNIKKVPNVKMVAFCDLVLERAERAAKEYGTPDAKVFTDYKDLVALADVDVVHVLTPNYAHSFISVAALDAGKHVMCEKPMAMTYAEAQSMCEAAKRNNKLLTIGYQSRSTSSSQYLKKLIKEGELGDVYFIKCPAIRRRGVPGWGVFIDKAQQGGGPLIDIATHSIDNALFITGMYDVESVMGSSYLKLGKTQMESNEWGSYDIDKFTTEDAAFAFVKFKNGCTMIVETSWMLNTLEGGSTIFCGDKAGASLGDEITINGNKGPNLYTHKIKALPKNRMYFKDNNFSAEEYEQRQWYAAIREGTELLTKPEEAAVVTKIIEAIYTSSETGKAVYFD